MVTSSDDDEEEELLKARIASHPRYPSLLQAYINCQKVGAPPELASLLDGIIIQQQQLNRRNCLSFPLGSDPELDHFMETYCEVLVRYRSDLDRPFQEATAFLSTIHSQLSDLCTTTPPLLSAPPPPTDDHFVGSSEEEESGGETDIPQELTLVKGDDKDLKNRLLRKYGGYLSSLRKEFSKMKKKGKLPKEARQTLLEWWTSHYKWPYPTEQDKIALAEATGLDQKQINNWFINQRKRHWKPSESMQLAVMGNLSAPFCDD